MNEDALRIIIREAVARHIGTVDASTVDARQPDPQPLTLSQHPSHFRYALPPSGGPCLIEPTVQCNHCGYCESHGH